MKPLILLICLPVLVFLFKYIVFKLIIQSKDDSHIWDILKSKFDSSFRTFDTSLYTCAREFDFIDGQTIFKLTESLLIPIAGLVFIFYLTILIHKIVSGLDNDTIKTDCVIFYNLVQFMVYTIMAVLIMRLKLFWTPHLCILASLLAHNQKEYNIFDLIQKKISIKQKFTNKYIIFLIIGLISYQGIKNIQLQRSNQGQYSDYSMEKMIIWINQNTMLNDAFVGSMPTMANVKLSTNRPIIDHPHYEHEGLRERVGKIYSYLYGYRNIDDIYSILKDSFKAKYLILEAHLCKSFPKEKPQCGMSNIAHINLEKTSNKQACINILEQNQNTINKFKLVYRIKNYYIFKVV